MAVHITNATQLLDEGLLLIFHNSFKLIQSMAVALKPNWDLAYSFNKLFG
jgi:hypothetical protein